MRIGQGSLERGGVRLFETGREREGWGGVGRFGLFAWLGTGIEIMGYLTN